MDSNYCVIEGFLVADPALIPIGNRRLAKFSLAHEQWVDRDGTKKRLISVFDVCSWDLTADLCMHFLKKGSLALAKGRLKEDRWTDSDGQPHTKVSLVASHVDFNHRLREAANGEGLFDLQDSDPASSTDDEPPE